MWNDFINFILDEVHDQQINIAEIGIGQFDKIANELSKKENINLIKTDIKPKDESIIRDDVTKPNLDLYKDIDFIYSIRPPNELQPHIINLACKINSQLIIKPLTNENLNTCMIKMKLKNYKKASFYILK